MLYVRLAIHYSRTYNLRTCKRVCESDLSQALYRLIIQPPGSKRASELHPHYRPPALPGREDANCGTFQRETPIQN